MPGDIIRAQCGCEFRACSATAVDVSTAEWRVAAYGEGANNPFAAQSPAYNNPQPAQPHAPPPPPQPAFAQLLPSGLQGWVRTPVERQLINPSFLRVPNTPGGVHPFHPNKKLPTKDNVFIRREQPRQRGGKRSAPASPPDVASSSRREAHREKFRRGNAAREEATHARLEPDEEYPDLFGSVGDAYRRPGAAYELYNSVGQTRQYRPRTHRPSNKKNRNVRFAANPEFAPRRETRPEGVYRQRSRRGTTKDDRVHRNVAPEPEWEELEDESPEVVFERGPVFIHHIRYAEADRSALRPSSRRMEAQHEPRPHPQHNQRRHMSPLEHEFHRSRGLGPQRILISDLSRLPEGRLEPARPHPAAPAGRAPSAPVRRRSPTQRTLPSRPPRNGSARAGKQVERRTLNAYIESDDGDDDDDDDTAAAAAAAEESDSPFNPRSPQLGEPGPSTWYWKRPGKGEHGYDERRRRNESQSSAAESSRGLVAQFGGLEVCDDPVLMDGAW
ncbi:hypothetical protein MMC11_001214 [Xylographa trunciseda]|nr:hypothetical protein [Xylographa trunciseda]